MPSPRSRATDLDRRGALRVLGHGLAGTVIAIWLVEHRARAQDIAVQTAAGPVQPPAVELGRDAIPAGLRVPDPSLPTLAPGTVQATENAIREYEAILARGGWPRIETAECLRLGARGPSVAELRRRLLAVGDLDASEITEIYDPDLKFAVQRFQARHGLYADGIVREQTLRALNLPAALRLAQLKTNLSRLRPLTTGLGARYVTTNIPAAQVEAVENNAVVAKYTAIVGKPDRPSPEIHSKIFEVNFSPYWTAPASIVRRDLMPKMQAEPDYLVKNRIHIFDTRGRELQAQQVNWYSDQAVSYRFKQDPGDLNSLGSIRINFPNSHDVYMHDTPFKNLFGEDFRFHSAGCVRVQNIRELVAWLLAGTPGWSGQVIDRVLRTGERRDARLAASVPLSCVYLTAWATPDGIVQFRDDIYNRDRLGGYAAGGASVTRIGSR